MAHLLPLVVLVIYLLLSQGGFCPTSLMWHKPCYNFSHTVDGFTKWSKYCSHTENSFKCQGQMIATQITATQSQMLLLGSHSWVLHTSNDAFPLSPYGIALSTEGLIEIHWEESLIDIFSLPSSFARLGEQRKFVPEQHHPHPVCV